jgi:hypothetical protein
MKPAPNVDRTAFEQSVNRRTFLGRSACGLGSLALAGLLEPQAPAAGNAPAAGAAAGRWRGVVNPLHYPARARRIIHLCMAGGPSQFESLDWKPDLKRLDKQPFPESFTRGQQLAQLQGAELRARGPSVEFRKHGASGQEISDHFPHIAGIADDLCIVRSMQTEQINHDPAHAFMNSGSILKGRPSMGSWLLYGLGSESDDLPGFIVLTSAGKSGQQPVSARQWSAGFLPSKFQGILFQSRGDAVHYIGSPEGVCQSTQRQVIEEVNRLNGLLAEDRLDPEIHTRISQYEMAFRMQTSVPELTDFASEPQAMLDLYGVKQPGDGSFASNCLLARRLAERGVRFIQLYHRAWDHHSNLDEAMPLAAADVDRASAALVKDLKQRGLLEDTLVIWGGEFGRTPMGQGTGRDHHILSFSLWMAGGGIKPGITYGATDELGYRAVEDVVHVRDLHATLLHLCGIDHRRLRFKYQGLDVRLTGVDPARVLRPILA